MKHLFTICFIAAALQGCNQKQEKVTIEKVSSGTQDSAATQNIQEEKIPSVAQETAQPEISSQIPVQHKLNDVNDMKPIMVAVMAPMSGKNDMIGNAIMDGAHLGLISLFEKHKIPVRLNVIDTGSNVEDIEFNISKLDETQYDIVLGLTSAEQEEFVKAYAQNNSHQPFLMPLNPQSKIGCAVSPIDQIQTVLNSYDDKIYVILPKTANTADWSFSKVEVIQYEGNTPEAIQNELSQIAKRLSSEKSVVIFSEANWKLQKFMSALEGNNVQVILAPLSNTNNRMQTVNERRHKFGNIFVVGPEQNQYEFFMREFFKVNRRKPLEISFLAYNAIQNLEFAELTKDGWSFTNMNCKPQLQVFNTNVKN